MTDLQKREPQVPTEEVPLDSVPPVDSTVAGDPLFAAGENYAREAPVLPATPNFADVDAVDTNDKGPKSPNRRRRIVIAIGAVATAVVVAGVVWFASSKGSGPKPTHTISASAKPPETATPPPTEETVAQLFEVVPIAETPAIVQQLEAMPMTTPAEVEAFSATPKEDQLTWFSWATNNNIPAYATQYEAQTLESTDVYPATISINNTPSQALTIGYYNIDVARSMPTAADAQKALIAALPNGIQDGAYPLELAKLKIDIVPWQALSPSDVAEDISFNVTNSPAVETDPQGRQFMDIKSSYTGTNDVGTSSSGNNENKTYFNSYKDFKGKNQSTWLTS